ncbi:MAG: BamA/TamA family outer membrane protein [Bacteroidota bacterium]|nr:BamA/TamA family outer membrane protein [Bacteroidota bacterium]
MNPNMVKILKSSLIKAFLIFIFAIIIFGCKSTKYVSQDEYLLDKYKIEIKNKNIEKSELKNYIRQKPNKRILGFKFHLFLYNLSNTKKEKGISKWFRTIGEEPVIFDSYLTNKSARQIKTFLNNKSYFNAIVKDTVIRNKKKSKVKVIYKIETNRAYKIGKIKYNVQDPLLRELIYADTSKSLVISGKEFDVDLFQNERKRIERKLKNNGYFNFNKEYIFIKADSSRINNIVDVTINIKKYIKKRVNDSLVLDNHYKYKINRVFIYTDYQTKKALEGREYLDRDTTVIDSLCFIHRKDKKLKTSIILQSNFIKPGDFYDLRNVDRTYKHINDLRLYRFINMQFIEQDSLVNDSSKIAYVDCKIQLSKFKLQSYTIETVGTNSSGNMGIGGNFIYGHKSLFGGAEHLDLKLKGSIEALDDNQSNRIDRTIEFGSDVTLSIPKFMLPIFKAEKFSKKYNPKTSISLGYNYQDRPDYTRTIANFSYGYDWHGNKFIHHFIKPLELNAVNIPYKTSDFDDYISSTFLESSYMNHLVSVTSYNFIFNNQNIKKNRDFYFCRLNAEVSGNILNSVYKLSNASRVDGSYHIFGMPFSQYFKTDIDFRYHKILNEANNFAYRLFAGVGLPYGNSDGLPFEKKYFAGGANSIRAWNVRDIGPGSYQGKDVSNFPNQTADIKIEANFEYRFKLFWVLEGALFIDAGNIWTIKEDLREGARFELNDFYNEIAVGTGFGTRFDFSFFIFRLDIGLKLRDPALEIDKRWIPGNRNFVGNDVNFNIGIGYPF